ncbi:hypothetical protein BC834DRAFT_251627 [Gloeopeniophorella convolvens]|nr:hypothetical protein BC834DRAFT_251627 [Gloeopeniophorella convolvens]
MDVDEQDEEEKPKKKAAPKKAPAAKPAEKAPAKKTAEKKAPAKRAASKKVYILLFTRVRVSHIWQKEVEESGEDFADEIDNVPGDEDEVSEAESKKRKVCPVCYPGHRSANKGGQRPVSKAAAKPASKKAKPASSRSKKAKAISEDEDDEE